MAGKLEGKVAVITGGTRGLGFAIATTYAREGAKIVIASRSKASIDQAVKVLTALGAQVVGLVCEVGDMAQVEALAAHAIKTFGSIDIWVNNAGVSAPYGPSAHIPSSKFLRVIDTNIIGVYNGSVVAVRSMYEHKAGKIINLLGRGDTGAVAMQNAYSSSKVWVRNFTKTLAEEYKNSGIEIFGFNPGLVKTDMLSQVEAVAGYESRVNPLRYVTALWGNQANVAAQKALWLASDASNGKTGRMASVLTNFFMLGRMFTVGLRFLLHLPVEMLELNVTSVEPVSELVPVIVD